MVRGELAEIKKGEDRMKYFIDGDQLVITRDDFVDLQESPAVFYPLDSDMAQAVLEAEAVTALPPGELMHARDILAIVLVTEGKPTTGDFDKSFYTDDHDVPALWIGGQIVAIGDGDRQVGFGYYKKDEDHLRWKLDPDKTYRVTIEEIA